MAELSHSRCSSPDCGDDGRHPFAAVIKPTDRCNLACRYCYVTHRAPVRAMTLDILEAAIAAVPAIAARRRALHFIWHGGEPMLLGLGFFEQVLRFQHRHCRGWTLDNCVQTNGTLLDREATTFFTRHGFAVSLSLDGPMDLHDASRTTARGAGSHAKVMAAVQRLREQRQTVGAVAVLTRASAARIADVYAFMKRSGVQFRVNPVVAPDDSGVEQLSPEEYGRAMCELFDLWLADDDPPHIDPIHLIVGNMMSDQVWGCDFHGGCCRDVVAINADGSVYPCGQLAGRPEFLLGNVTTDAPDQILRTPLARRLLDRRRHLRRRCQDCDFVGICGGGCLATAWIRQGDAYARDYFCEGRKHLFDHIRSALVGVLRRAGPGGDHAESEARDCGGRDTEGTAAPGA